jgi:hypothetical protein
MLAADVLTFVQLFRAELVSEVSFVVKCYNVQADSSYCCKSAYNFVKLCLILYITELYSKTCGDIMVCLAIFHQVLAVICHREIRGEASGLRFRNNCKEGVYEIFCHFTEGFMKTTWNVRILPFFWDMTCCQVAFGSRLSEGTYRLHLQVSKESGLTDVPLKIRCRISHWHGDIRQRDRKFCVTPGKI